MCVSHGHFCATRPRCRFGATPLVGELPRSNGQTTAWPSAPSRARKGEEKGKRGSAGSLYPLARGCAFVEHYNHVRYHESINNLTPADVYFGRAETILAERHRIKRATIANRRLQHQLRAA